MCRDVTSQRAGAVTMEVMVVGLFYKSIAEPATGAVSNNSADQGRNSRRIFADDGCISSNDGKAQLWKNFTIERA
jgi:hypothetical protein